MMNNIDMMSDNDFLQFFFLTYKRWLILEDKADNPYIRVRQDDVLST